MSIRVMIYTKKNKKKKRFHFIEMFIMILEGLKHWKN